MSNLDHDMLSMFLVAFRMRRKLAQVSLNQHGPSTSRSACAALRTRMAARQERVGALLCASPLARTAAAQCAPLAGLTSAATPLPRPPNTAPALPLAQPHNITDARALSFVQICPV